MRREVRERSDSEGSESKIVSEDPLNTKLNTRVRSKEAMKVVFQGIIESGTFKAEKGLSVFLAFSAGKDWEIVEGQKSGISQYGSGQTDNIVWNFPFGVTYETAYLGGWPQVIIALYGRDFFGRSVIKGYGNVHLPMQNGEHARIVRTFSPIAATTIGSCCASIMGYIQQYKNYERILGEGENRELTRSKNNGEIRMKVRVRRVNFQEQGYQ